MVAWETVLEKALQNPEVREAWDDGHLADEVSNWVMKYRLDHHLTQTALARQLGMKQQAVARLEVGEVEPSFQTIRHLCKTLGGAMALYVDAAGWVRVELDWEPEAE